MKLNNPSHTYNFTLCVLLFVIANFQTLLQFFMSTSYTHIIHIYHIFITHQKTQQQKIIVSLEHKQHKK